jgi:transcriptional regulator with XRE-family HTH domain
VLSDNELRLEVGRRLRLARKSRDFGVRQLATYAGVSAALVSRIEKGEILPSFGNFRVLATVLKVRPSDLLPLESKPDPRLLRQKFIDLAIGESLCFSGADDKSGSGRSYVLVWSGSISTSECIVRKLIPADQFVELTGERHKSLRSEADGTKLILFGQIVPTDFVATTDCASCQPISVKRIRERDNSVTTRRLVS